MANFFVYIIESPSAPDIYHGRSEGKRIEDTLRLDDIDCVTRPVINAVAFKAALQIGLAHAMELLPDKYPIVHLSAHGSQAGIQLSSGEVIEWSALRELLVPINESLLKALCSYVCLPVRAIAHVRWRWRPATFHIPIA